MVPALFVTFIIFAPLLAQLPCGAVATKVALFFYALLSLFFSIYESVREKNAAAILLLPPVFFIVHAAYGCGCIYGLWVRLRQKSDAIADYDETES